MADQTTPTPTPTTPTTRSGVADCPCCGHATMVDDWTKPALCDDCADAECSPDGPCDAGNGEGEACCGLCDSVGEMLYSATDFTGDDWLCATCAKSAMEHGHENAHDCADDCEASLPAMGGGEAFALRLVCDDPMWDDDCACEGEA